jgi:hypothetical protein
LPTKIEVLGAIDVNGPPSDEDRIKTVELDKQVAKKIKA